MFSLFSWTQIITYWKQRSVNVTYWRSLPTRSDLWSWWHTNPMTKLASINSLSSDKGQFRKLGKVNGLSTASLPYLFFPSTESDTPQPWGCPPLPPSKPLSSPSIAGWTQKVEAGPSLYFSFRQSAETVQSARNVIWLKRAERMEGQKQLNPNCFSFHRPPENRGDAGREVLWILHSVPFFEVWTMDNSNCSYRMVSWGYGTCLSLGESWDFCVKRLNDLEVSG